MQTYLRPEEVDKARKTFVSGCRAGHGGIVFIAGSEASGRTMLLADIARELGGERYAPCIVSGRMSEGRYVPAHDQGPAPEVLSALGGVLGVAGAAVPALALVGQVLTLLRATHELVKHADREGVSTLQNLARSIRAAARERPLVCLVDDADAADGRWWSELLLGLANEIGRDLPVFLFLSVDGGAVPGPHRDDEPDAVFAARQLTGRHLASWWFLPPLRASELVRLTEAADDDVLARLEHLTAGRLGWAQALWTEWRDTGVVERDTDLGPWRFSPGQPARSGSLADILRARISRAIGDDLEALDAAWKLLSCCALEGRYFTADAIASTLGWDRDHVLDTLDDRLSGSNGSEALVTEVGYITVAGPDRAERHLWRYRFASDLFRSALLHFGFTAKERSEMSGALASGLEQCYGAARLRIAGPLGRLWAASGDNARAADYRRLAGLQLPGNVVLDRAQHLMAGAQVDEWDRAQCRRAIDLLLEAGKLLTAGGQLDQVIAAMQVAIAAARRGRLPAEEADALMTQGATELYMGSPGAGRAHMDSALAIWRSLRRLDGQAECLKHLAWIDGLAGEHELAVQGLEQSRSLLLKIGLHERVLDSYLQQANLALRWADLNLAASSLRSADHFSAFGTAYSEAQTVELHGVLAVQLGDYEEALAYYRRAAAAFRELSEPRAEASVMRGIGLTLVQTGDLVEARRVLSDSVLAAQSMENLAGEAEARYGLAHLEMAADHADAAVLQFEAALHLYREVGQTHMIEPVERELKAARDAAR
jgi:tetratricopeptide (TPR) repeat protein